jgi:hypothetical protein
MKLEWGYESHPKTLLKYWHMALTAIAAVCISNTDSME